VELKDIKDLMGYLEENKLKKIVIKRGDFELELERESKDVQAVQNPLPTYIPQQVEAAAPAAAAVDNSTPAASGADDEFVTSPMVGTFYLSPSPDQPCFIKVGDRVEEGTVVCIIEAMKVMNEVKAGVKGVVAEILLDNAQPVEFGSKIFRIV